MTKAHNDIPFTLGGAVAALSHSIINCSLKQIVCQRYTTGVSHILFFLGEIWYWNRKTAALTTCFYRIERTSLSFIVWTCCCLCQTWSSTAALSGPTPTRVLLSNDRRRQRHQTVSFFRQLTLLDARRDGDEGHEAAEAQVDPQQRLVEVAGDGVRVVLVHEGEGHGGDGIEEEGGAHHGQVPALVLGGSSQPAGGDTHAVARDSAFGEHPHSSYSLASRIQYSCYFIKSLLFV